ncbi:hypothetical protein VDGE_03000 [Verticillium dahliae]|uniref:Nuclear pore complex protein n=2 Tax=Verticillium TaxID=1036719 RepID=A0A444RQC9_VERDA|nr:hypothetical protein VDGE_03000 [Verticillium dahliae]
MTLQADLRDNPPCHARACEIQNCLSRNGLNDAKCQAHVLALYQCCEAFYREQGDSAVSASCPKADLLRLKKKQMTAQIHKSPNNDEAQAGHSPHIALTGTKSVRALFASVLLRLPGHLSCPTPSFTGPERQGAAFSTRQSQHGTTIDSTLRSAHRNVKPGSGEAGSALNLSIRTPKNRESITAPLSFSFEAEHFANAVDDCLGGPGSNQQKQERVLELVQRFYNHASERLDQLRHRGSGNLTDNEMDVDDAEDETDPAATISQIRKWESELQTWDLLQRLVTLRYPQTKSAAVTGGLDAEIHSRKDDLWGSFVAQTDRTAERKTVLEWLQHTATTGPAIDELIRDLQQNAERGQIIAHGCIHSRTALKLHKDLLGASRPLDPLAANVAQSLMTSDKAPLVSQLDPDAVTRQSRKLEPQDEFFERAIWVGCYQLLRRGCTLAKIQEWCAERTETWRAVSLSALPSAGTGDAVIHKEDAHSIALWRRMCFASARHAGTDEIESAVYGVLAGDIQSVEKVCKSWDDFMFMHYNALLRSQFDSYVLEQCQPEMSANIDQQFAVFDAVQYHGEESTTEKRLIKSLKVHKLTRDEALMPLKVLQAALITKETSQHFLQQGVVLARERGEVDTEPTNTEADTHGFVNGRDYDTLRVAVHVLIVLSTLDDLDVSTSLSPTLEREPQARAIQETIISSYVTLLRLAQYEELIPLYCSKLSMPRAFEVLSINLRHLTDRDTRLNQLELIQKSGLDVLRFVKMQPRLILSQLGNVEQEAGSRREPFRIIEAGPGSLKYGRLIKIDFFGEDPDAISEEEELLIRSLEWLLLVDEAWPDVFFVGVKVYKYFLGTMRLNAARQLANRVTMSQVLQQRISLGGQEEADIAHVPEIDDAFWADQLEAIGDRQTSSRLLATQARIFRDLECLVKALDTMETIASLTELSREDPSAKRDFWNQVGNEVKNAKEYVEPMFKGWLLVDEDDAQCLQALRDTYLPETILAYISIHEKSGLSWTGAHNNAFVDGRKVTRRGGLATLASGFDRWTPMYEIARKVVKLPS